MNNIRYQVVLARLDENFGEVNSPFPILYATRAEAEALKARLEIGGDPSFYDAETMQDGYLDIEEFYI